MALTDTVCRTCKPTNKTQKLFDSKGLYLEVTPKGGKYWRFKYRFLGKEKLLALGAYPVFSLSEAREKHLAARKLLAEGTDPSEAKKQEKRERLLKTENAFEKVGREWHENKKISLSSRHAQYVLRRLETDIFPAIGTRPINEITAPELLSVLRGVEKRGALDIAHRLCQTCGQIFRYAIVTGRAERDPAAELRGALKSPPHTHYAHLKTKELPEFLQKLTEYDGQLLTKLGLRLMLLTFVRTGELRGAEWEEIDFEKGEWRIPPTRMKMKQQHIVPLSSQSLSVLQDLKKLTGNNRYVFPNRSNPAKHMSENTLLYALYRMGYHLRTTIHGFRSTASTTLNEMGFRADVIERQLAHSERNKIRASYNHAEYLPERRQMMQHWADYLDAL